MRGELSDFVNLKLSIVFHRILDRAVPAPSRRNVVISDRYNQRADAHLTRIAHCATVAVNAQEGKLSSTRRVDLGAF